MFLTGDLFSSEKSIGKKIRLPFSADCQKFGPSGTVSADPAGGHGSGLFTMGLD